MNINLEMVKRFISHMVQMKAEIYPKYGFWFETFISHMVQMKGFFCATDSCVGCELYIPHGSDESYYQKDDYYTKSQLYIPHGSDESYYRKREYPITENFISHMVQMKVMPDTIAKESKITFISHMVQMKELFSSCVLRPSFPLYPTWFR